MLDIAISVPTEGVLSKRSRIFVAGHRGMVGSAFQRSFTEVGYTRLIVRTRAELNQLDQQAVQRFFDDIPID